MGMENNTTVALLDLDLDCPEFTENSEEVNKLIYLQNKSSQIVYLPFFQVLHQITFWVEGALSCGFAFFGFFGNVGSSVILSRKGKIKCSVSILAQKCYNNDVTKRFLKFLVGKTVVYCCN